MIKITTSNIEQFRIFFDVVYDVANEIIELKFYTDHFTCAVLDGGRTRFFYVEYEMKFFDLYNVDEFASVCVSLEDMYKLLKLANKSDTLTLEFSDEMMSAELESPVGNKRLFEFVLPSDYIDSPRFPNVQLPSHIEVDTSILKQSVKDISLIGTDIFQFVLSENQITLMSDSSVNTSSYSSTKYAQVIDDVETGTTEPLAVRFTLDFIAQMIKFEKVSKNVSIDIGDLALTYKFQDEIMGISVHGMIAPRVEVESDE